MSYTELEQGYQGLRSATNQPVFYVGDIGGVQQGLVGPGGSSLYGAANRGELSDGGNDDGCLGGSDFEGEGKQVLVGICAMAKKSQSKPMKEILTRLEEFEYIKILVFAEEVILKESVEDWPIVDCLISFHSKGFPLDKAIQYANLRNPFIINNLPMQYDIQDRRKVYSILEGEGIEIPRYAVLDRDSSDPKHHELVESEDHVEVNGVTFNKPFVEKPVSAEDHNIYIYYPTSAGGGSQRLFRKIGSRSSVYSPESRVRKTGSYIYEDFMPTDGTDVKVYTVGPDYAHAEARKSPALDGKVERDSEGKEIRYPVILSNAEKLISRKVCLAFKQTVCGFDLLRANGKSFVCDVNGFSFVKNSNKYYDDCAKILGNMILRELAPTLHIPWSVPFQLDDPPIVPTTFGKMMELRCVVAVIRHGDRTPKQKMKVEVRHPKFFEIFAKYDGYKHGHVKLKRPKQLQEILDTARSLLTEIQHRAAGPELEEKQGKLEQLKSVLEMYGHFSGINRKVQMKYQPRGRPRGSSSDDGNSNRLGEPSLVLILKWGGELTPAGRIQAEELGRIFRCMYPGGQGRHLSEEDSEMLPNHGEYAGAQGLGLLRLHSTFRHDLKIYASDEGRVQMTAAAFAKGLLALEGELTPILVQMVKSANTNGLLDNDCDSSKYQNMVKNRLHELMQQDKEFTREDREQINPTNALSINAALDFVKNPVRCCQHVHLLIQKLMDVVRIKKDDPKTKDAILYHGETWELMGRRWGKIEKDFCTKQKRFDISKIPDIYDCIKYDLQHNNHTLQFEHAEELYIYSKYLADIVIPQEYGLTVQEKLTIGQGICTPLLKKIRADLQRNIEEPGEESVNRLNPRYSHGVSSPGRHVRTRLYFTSESHVHSLLTVLRYGGLIDIMSDEQWRRAMEYVSMVSELNYMSQIVVMLYEDPTKDPSSEERFHVELHFSPGVNCCVQKNLPPGPGFRPHSRNESSHNLGESGLGQDNSSQCSTRIEEEDTELVVLEDDVTSPPRESDTSPPLMETESADSTLDSPTTSRAINMMDLDPNIMDEPYDSGFLQSSAPIPISARTVAGHEAARLGSQLAASQRQRRERDIGVICEPRARSYDHQRQDKPDKTADKLQYQSLDAVNKEGTRAKPRSGPRISVQMHEECAVSVGPTLPHSLSSPELLASGGSRPIVNVLSESPPSPLSSFSQLPPPLITLHNTPLASPGAVSAAVLAPPLLIAPVARHASPVPVVAVAPVAAAPEPTPLLLRCPSPPMAFRRYGRSHSAMTLPLIEISGESPCPSPASADRGGSLDALDEALLQLLPRPSHKRSRSLSPLLLHPNLTAPTPCSCYNCNVSELIVASRDLSPSERSNFRTYFSRSLSHKFINCSCYSLTHRDTRRPRRASLQTTPSPIGRAVAGSRSRRNLQLRRRRRRHSCPAAPSSAPGSLCCSAEPSSSGSSSNACSSRGSDSSSSSCCSSASSRCSSCSSSGSSGASCSSSVAPSLHHRSRARRRRRRSLDCLRTVRRWQSRRLLRRRRRRRRRQRSRRLREGPLPCIRSSRPRRRRSSQGELGRALDKLACSSQLRSHRHRHHHRHQHPHRDTLRSNFLRALPQQRSFSSPDARPIITQPADPTCTARRHRHSISGQMSYFKLLGYNVSKKLAGSTNSLFSTAVISGSSSAPNLKDMVPPHASAVAAIEGFGGVPPIRPLETLHNALSLRQLDSFLEMMTGVPLFRTPASSPPKFASPVGPGGYHQSLGIDAAARYITPTPIYCSRGGNDGDASEMRSLASPTSPNSTTGWGSESVSFLSSEPSSPAPTSAGECSMSMSLISNDGSQPFSGAGAPGGNRPYSPSRCLDLDMSDFCVGMPADPLVQHQSHSQQQHQQCEPGSHASVIRESRGSVSYTDYYSSEDGQIRRSANDNCFPVYVAPGSPSPAAPATAAAVTTSSSNDDSDEHTLTLRQSEPLSCATKHDVQTIFAEQSEPNATPVAESMPRPSSSYKKIGRFRVESMEVADGDARLKESSSLSCSLSSSERGLAGSRLPPATAQQQRSQRKANAPGGPSPQLLRSQSVHAPRSAGGSLGSARPAALLPKQSSLSAAATPATPEARPAESTPGRQPTLTLASSLTGSSRVTFGFDPSPNEPEP